MGIIASRIPVIPYLRYGKTQTHSFAGAPYNVYEVPRYFKSRVALSQDEISHIAHFDVSKVARRPQYRRILERVAENRKQGYR